MLAKLLFAASFATTVLAAAVYHQHSALLAQASSLEADWQQPAELRARFPTPVSTRYWPFDFRDLDKQFANFIDGQRDALRVDASLARQFKQSTEGLPGELAPESLARIELLLQKSYAGTAGEDLAKLFVASYRYEQARRKLRGELAAQLPAGSVQLASRQYEQDLLLQGQHFSPRQAEQLFGEANRTAHYLVERLRIRQDAKLSAAEKRSALERLQQNFRGAQ